jgi:hypothetical protein
VEKADLEVPERNKPLLLCQQCFAMIPNGAEFCAECGAPVVDDFGEGSERTVYPELARANLLRMRGQYKIAEDICLAILRRHPNSATANTILGDICAEKGDLKQAAEWYEMALDITPDSESDREKLESVRRRIREHEAAQTAKTLGLPESRPKIGIWVGGAVVFILLIAVIAYLLGERMNQKRQAGGNEVNAPVSIPLESSRESTAGGAGTGGQPPATSSLLENIKAGAAAEAARIAGASRFPDTMGVLLTFTTTGTEDPRLYAAQLGKVALERAPDAPSVTLMAMREGKVVYSGTMTRERFQAATSPDGQAQIGADPAAFASATLSDEWPPPATAPPPGEGLETPDPQPPGGATEGTNG